MKIQSSLKFMSRVFLSAGAMVFLVSQSAQALFLEMSVGPGVSHAYGDPSSLGSRVNVNMTFADSGSVGTFTATVHNDSIFDSGSITAFALSLHENYFDSTVTVGFSKVLDGCEGGNDCATAPSHGADKRFTNTADSLFDGVPFAPFSTSNSETFDIGAATGSATGSALGGDVKTGIEKGEFAFFTWTVGLTSDFNVARDNGGINTMLDVLSRQTPTSEGPIDAFWVARLQGIGGFNCGCGSHLKDSDDGNYTPIH